MLGRRSRAAHRAGFDLYDQLRENRAFAFDKESASMSYKSHKILWYSRHLDDYYYEQEMIRLNKGRVNAGINFLADVLSYGRKRDRSAAKQRLLEGLLVDREPKNSNIGKILETVMNEGRDRGVLSVYELTSDAINAFGKKDPVPSNVVMLRHFQYESERLVNERSLNRGYVRLLRRLKGFLRQ